MSLLIVIPIAFIFLIIFWARNVSLYKSNYTYGMDGLKLSIVDSYNILHAPRNYKPLEVTPNFFAFTANLILKFIHFIIFSVVTYIFRDITTVGIVATIIYALFTSLAWFGYNGRNSFYNEITHSIEKEAFAPIMKACICIPIYQTIILILLIFV